MNSASGKNLKFLLIAAFILAISILAATVFADDSQFMANDKGSSLNTGDFSDAPVVTHSDGATFGVWKDNIMQFSHLYMDWLRSVGLNSHHDVIQRMVPIFLRLLVPLYMILILITGILFIWGTVSPNSRAQTKTQMQKLIIGMIMCGLCMQIFDVIISLNNYLVDQILLTQGPTQNGPHWEYSIVQGPTSDANEIADWTASMNDPDGREELLGGSEPGVYNVDYALQIINEDNGQKSLEMRKKASGAYTTRIVPANWDPITGFFDQWKGAAMAGGMVGLLLVLTGGLSTTAIMPILCTLFTMMLMPFVVLAIRYDFCILYGILLPLTIFCMSFDFLKKLGDNLMKQTLTWIFLPVPMAVFTVLARSLANTSSWNASALAGFAAWVLIGASPMMITGMLGGLGSITAAVGQTMVDPRLVFIGNVLQGQSAASLSQAAFTAQRMKSREQTGRDSASAYNVGSSLPTDASTAQPPSPDSAAYRRAMGTGGASWTAPRGAPGGGDGGGSGSGGGGGGGTGSGGGGSGTASGGSGGGGAGGAAKAGGSSSSGGGGRVDSGGVFARGIGMKERAMRFAFGAPVEAGTPDWAMTSQQARGLRFQQAEGAGAKIGLAMAGVAGNVSPMKLMAPAGYYMRGMLRQTLHDWEIGKTLGAVSWKMTGGWVEDPVTGKTHYHRGWQSSRGMVDDLAKSSAEMYKGFKPGDGAPPAVKAGLKGLGMALPVVALATPAGPLIGLGVAAIAMTSVGLGAKFLRGRGEALLDDDNIRNKIGKARKEKGAQLNKDEVWGIVSDGDKDDKRKKRFGYTGKPEDTEAAKDKAFKHYTSGAAVTAGKAASSGAGTGQSLHMPSPAGATGSAAAETQWDQKVQDAANAVDAAKAAPVPTAASLAMADGRIKDEKDFAVLPAAQQGVYNAKAATAAAAKADNITKAESDLDTVKADRGRAYTQSSASHAAARSVWADTSNEDKKKKMDAAGAEIDSGLHGDMPNTKENREAIGMHKAYEEGKGKVFGGMSSDQQNEQLRNAAFGMAGSQQQGKLMKDAAWELAEPVKQAGYMRDAAWNNSTEAEQRKYLSMHGGSEDMAKNQAVFEEKKKGNGGQIEDQAKQMALNDSPQAKASSSAIYEKASGAALTNALGDGKSDQVTERAQGMALEGKVRDEAQQSAAWNQLKGRDRRAATKAADGDDKETREKNAKADAPATLQRRQDEKWDGMGRQQRDDTVIQMTGGRYNASNAPPEVLQEAKANAYGEKGIARAKGAGRRIMQDLRSITPRKVGERDGLEGGVRASSILKIAGTSVLSPTAGAAAGFSYWRGYRQGKKRNYKKGTPEYSRAKNAKFNELQSNEAKIDKGLSDRQGAPTIVGKDGKAYTIESDGVHEQSQWGAGRDEGTYNLSPFISGRSSKLKGPESDAVMEWYAENRDDKTKQGTYEAAAPSIDPGRQDEIAAAVAGNTPGEKPNEPEKPGLDQLISWQDKVEAGQDRSGYFERQIEDNSDRIGGEIMGKMTGPEKRQFGWNTTERYAGTIIGATSETLGLDSPKMQNKAAQRRALEYFIRKRRKDTGR